MAFRVRPQQITLTLGVFGSPVGFDIGEVRPRAAGQIAFRKTFDRADRAIRDTDP
jgi:hypothetical protein